MSERTKPVPFSLYTQVSVSQTVWHYLAHRKFAFLMNESLWPSSHQQHMMSSNEKNQAKCTLLGLPQVSTAVMRMCVSACTEAREQHQASSLIFPVTSVKRSLTEPEDRLGWLTSKLQASIHLCLPTAGITDVGHGPRLCFFVFFFF